MVHPLPILDPQQRGLGPGPCLNDFGGQGEQHLLAHLGLEARRSLVVGDRQAQQIAEQGQVWQPVWVALLHHRLHLGDLAGDHDGRSPTRDRAIAQFKESPEDLAPGIVGRVLADGLAGSGGHLEAPSQRPVDELGGQVALAHPCLPLQAQHLPFAGEGCRQHLLHLGQLLLPPDQGAGKEGGDPLCCWGTLPC